MAIKKKFIDIEIPIIDESVSALGTVESLHKKTIKLDLSRKLRGKGLEVVFLILNQNNKLVAYPRNLSLMKNYIQRTMRKRISYVEDSFETSCKDVNITIKPFLITRKKVSRAIRNNLRKTTKELILEQVKTKTFLELADSIIQGDFQKELHPKLKKIYPLSLCEIRVLDTKEIEKADLSYSRQARIDSAESVKEEKTQAEEIEEINKEKAKKNKEKEEAEGEQISSSDKGKESKSRDRKDE